MGKKTTQKPQVPKAYFIYSNREKQTANIRQILLRAALQNLKNPAENAIIKPQ
jgi:hypothetical protein